MYYSKAQRLAYIRIPKTGSTTQYETLKKALPDIVQNGDVHETFSEMKQRSDRRAHDTCARHNAFPDMNHGWRVVAFVRHPLDWLPSFFSMMTGPKSQYTDRWLQNSTGTENYWDAPDRGSLFLADLRCTPYDWFTHEGEVVATEIWRCEDMAGFCATWQKPWKHINKTGVRRQVTLDWTEEDLVMIRAMFARELAHYPERPV